MFNIISLIIGFIALVWCIVAFIPPLGMGEWLVLPLAIFGAGVGIVSRSHAGRNLNLFVLIVAIVRLIFGGGIF